jgi:hypothetical protein
MAITYGFFNSINGDRTYNADDISSYFLKLISNGVFATPSDSMQVQENDGMTVQVTPGWGFINCKWVKNSSLYRLTLDAADVVLNRIDRIVLRLDPRTTARTITIAVKKGTSATNPAAPALTRISGGVWELSIARIYVGAGATSITQADITDERSDTSVCGYVTGLIDQIDTTNLFAQFTAAFNDWFADIKTEVKTTTIVMDLSTVYTTTTANEDTIPIDISQYNETLDILEVYINGLKLIPGVDYTSDEYNVYLTTPLSVIGTPVNICVYKSTDTEDAASIVDVVQQLMTDAVTMPKLEQRLNGLSMMKLTRQQYDAMSAHDPDTIYYVTDGNTIVEYMGDIELKSGQGAAVGEIVGLLSGTTGGAVGAATEQS